MKRILCTLCTAALLLSLCACGKKIDYYYPTPEDVTMESLEERTIPQNMLSIDGGFQIDWRNEDESYAGAHASTTSMRYRYDGEKVLINQVVDYDNGEYTHLYFTSDLTDPVMFVDDDRSGVSVTDLTDRDMQNSLTQSLFGLEYYNCEITERSKEADGSYRITYDARDASLENQVVQHVVMTVEPIRGVVTGAEIYFYDYGVEAGLSTVNIIYSRNVRIDDSPRTKAIEQGVYDPDQVNNQTETESRTGSFNFACTDLDGTLHSISDYTGSDYIIVGYWEPESPDCVDELAELQDLYTDFGGTRPGRVLQRGRGRRPRRREGGGSDLPHPEVRHPPGPLPRRDPALRHCCGQPGRAAHRRALFRRPDLQRLDRHPQQPPVRRRQRRRRGMSAAKTDSGDPPGSPSACP